MFNTKVVTSFTNGTMVEMDAHNALNFLVGLSITVINTVRDIVIEEDRFGDKVTKSNDPDVMELISRYNSGIPGAIYLSILQTNADILLKFVQDVVLNETTRGLYLFYDKSNTRNGKAPYDLIVKALNDVHLYYMMHGDDQYRKNSDKYFNRYNEEFLNLMNKE